MPVDLATAFVRRLLPRPTINHVDETNTAAFQLLRDAHIYARARIMTYGRRTLGHRHTVTYTRDVHTLRLTRSDRSTDAAERRRFGGVPGAGGRTACRSIAERLVANGGTRHFRKGNGETARRTSLVGGRPPRKRVTVIGYL